MWVLLLFCLPGRGKEIGTEILWSQRWPRMSLSKYFSLAYQGSIQVNSLVFVGPCCGLSHLSCSKMLQNLIQNSTDEPIFREGMEMQTENSCVDTVGEGEGGTNWESGLGMYSTTMCETDSWWRAAVQHREPRLVLCDDLEGCNRSGEGGFQGGGTHTHIYKWLWLIHVVIRQKPTHHCKAIILQMKKKVWIPGETLLDSSLPGDLGRNKVDGLHCL